MEGVLELVNDFAVQGYSGPCTIEERGYQLRLWAIDGESLGLEMWSTPAQLRAAAEAATLDVAVLRGTFARGS